MCYCANTGGGMDTKIRVSTESWPWRRKFPHRSCRDLNPRPFNHESGVLTTEISPFPSFSYFFVVTPCHYTFQDTPPVSKDTVLSPVVGVHSPFVRRGKIRTIYASFSLLLRKEVTDDYSGLPAHTVHSISVEKTYYSWMKMSQQNMMMIYIYIYIMCII